MTTFDVFKKCSVTYSAPEKMKGEYRATARIWFNDKPTDAEFTVRAPTFVAAVDEVHREAGPFCARWMMKNGLFSSR